METKKVMIGFVALFLMLFSLSFALAENGSVSLNETPNLISVSEDVEINNISEEEATGNLFWKKADIWFTFNQEKKAEKELRLAELQLVRARIAAKNNNTKAMEGALEAHRNLIEKVQARISKFENRDSAKELRNATDKLVGLERATEVHELRIERLNMLLNQSNLSADEIARIQARIDQSQNNTQHLRDVAQQQRERNELKLKAMNQTGNGSGNGAGSNISGNQMNSGSNGSGNGKGKN